MPLYEKQALLGELKGRIFEGERGTIERVEMPYREFIHKLELLAASENTARPKGSATVVQDISPIDMFPDHDENHSNE